MPGEYRTVVTESVVCTCRLTPPRFGAEGPADAWCKVRDRWGGSAVVISLTVRKMRLTYSECALQGLSPLPKPRAHWMPNSKEALA